MFATYSKLVKNLAIFFKRKKFEIWYLEEDSKDRFFTHFEKTWSTGELSTHVVVSAFHLVNQGHSLRSRAEHTDSSAFP